IIFPGCHLRVISPDSPEHFLSDHVALAPPHPHAGGIEEAAVPIKTTMKHAVDVPFLLRIDPHIARRRRKALIGDRAGHVRKEEIGVSDPDVGIKKYENLPAGGSGAGVSADRDIL